jgi:glycosyltransferase involved in cell wall biosynthesis
MRASHSSLGYYPGQLLVISHTPHHRRGDEIVGWGPTVLEINHLAQFFGRINHVACFHPETAPASALPYSTERVHLVPVPPVGGNELFDKLAALARFPLYARVILRELSRADVVHVRCPANICLLALLLLTVRRQPRQRWIKYAGDWSELGRQPLSYRFQRWWLKRGWSRAAVTVNGEYSNQPKHVHSFYNPCLTDSELAEARQLAKRKPPLEPLHLLFVGALNSNKGVLRALETVRLVQSAGVRVRFEVVGDGPERAELERRIREWGLSEGTRLHGWLPRTALGDVYARNHCILMTSRSEGWPKVLSEAMAYGVVPVASAISCVSDWLQRFGTGRTARWDVPQEFATAILAYARTPQLWSQESARALEAARHFSYSTYLAAVQNLLRLSRM